MTPALRVGVQFRPSGKMRKTSLACMEAAIRVIPPMRSWPAPVEDGTKKDWSRVRMVSMPGSQRRASARTIRGSRPAVRESSQATARESAGPACRASASSGSASVPKCMRSARRTSRPTHRRA